ncbi:MAG TPA: FCD domain-containing protein [Chloroflexota bacterium]|nr:FCD domain-containing protein [Chloroflexota bacterium]
MFARPTHGRRLHETVVRDLAGRIISGALPGGVALPTEPELAAEYAVSRTVVREAVHALVAKGLVLVRHGVGTSVQPADHWDTLDPLVLFERVRLGRDGDLLGQVLEARRVIEVEAAGLAAERGEEPALEQLAARLAEMDHSLDEPATYTRFDAEFHAQLLATARNAVLAEMLRPVVPLLTVGRHITNLRARRPAASQEGHREIVAAVRAGDAAAARDAMRRHCALFEQDIKRELLEASPELMSEIALVAGTRPQDGGSRR